MIKDHFMSNHNRFSMLWCDELSFLEVVLFACCNQIVFGLNKTLSALGKSAPMDSHRLLAFDLFVNFDCLFRIHVLGLQKLSWLVGSYWQNGQVDRSEFMPYLLKDTCVSCIPRVIKFSVLRSFYDKSAPKSHIQISQSSPSPVTSGQKGDFVLSSFQFNGKLFHPVHSFLFGLFGKDVFAAQTHHKGGMIPLLYLFNCFCLEMISMVMTHKNYVYFRELTYLAGWKSVSLLFILFGKDGIDDEVVRSNLDNSCGMANPCVFDLSLSRFCEIGGNNWQFFLNELKVFITIWCSFAGK